MPEKIFINYRRDDSIGTAGRLHDRLVQAFGRKNVFMDVDHIPAGVDFVRHLNSQVAECDVFLAVIGPDWLDTDDGNGGRRLDNPDDFVRLELQAALGRDVRVIPVLVDGARMPRPAELPEPLRSLSNRQAVEVRNVQFGSDVERLIGKVAEALAGGRPGTALRWPVVAAGVATLLVVGMVGLNQFAPPDWLPWKDKAKIEAAKREEKARKEAETKRVADAERVQKDAETKRLADAAEARKKEEEARLKSRPLSRYEIRIVNNAGARIMVFHYSNCGTPNWGTNRLGQRETIPIGGQRVFNMDDGYASCCRDMKATLENGAPPPEKRGVDICRTNEWLVK